MPRTDPPVLPGTVSDGQQWLPDVGRSIVELIGECWTRSSQRREGGLGPSGQSVGDRRRLSAPVSVPPSLDGLGRHAAPQPDRDAARPTRRRACPPACPCAVPARGVADRRRPGAGADSRQRPLSGEVAPGADVAPPGAREWHHADGRAGRCRVRRQRPVSDHVAPAAAPVCGGGVVDADEQPYLVAQYSKPGARVP